MPDEILNENFENENENQDPNQNYIDAINKLKQNTVSKEEYDKLLEQNKQLLESLVNGETLEQPEDSESIDDIRKDLFDTEKEHLNLEFVSKALELRNRILDETGEDIFVARNTRFPTEAAASAERVASVFQQCIDRSGGDSNLFTAELQRRTNELLIPGVSVKKK